ncbi:GNAT family N-acetyltransferase [Paenibacillus filicis]|uniref:GNAT family N-acetyltransferase n=1 Tax=Paenibacillus filicis TaxID=669464 RepID=A0ABU9DRB6_9BACL
MQTSWQEMMLIEELMTNTWPAYTQQSYGSWKLRATFGTTKRANSVHAVGPLPERDGWLAEIESFYRRRGLPAYFCISHASPEGLDALLAEAGYELETPCLQMTATAELVLRSVTPLGRLVFELAYEADERWLEDFLRLEGYEAERLRGYRHIFSAIGPDKSFFRVLENGETVALGTVVSERGYAGISNIVVDPRHRRKGIAEQLFGRVAQWSLERGAEKLYLQVIRDNEPAVALYRKLGFETTGSYHYRCKRL